jgi:hypothetical protein
VVSEPPPPQPANSAASSRASERDKTHINASWVNQ